MKNNLLEITKKFLRENLSSLPHLDNPEKFSIGRHLLIKNNEGIEYTVYDVDISDISNPIITCYRYEPTEDTTFYIDIPKEEFSNYSIA